MPDHVHLLLTPTGRTISQTINLIKGGFSRTIASPFPTWQRGYTDHLIQTPADFRIRLDYIHQNPVRAGLSPIPEVYPYSSAYKPGLRQSGSA